MYACTRVVPRIHGPRPRSNACAAPESGKLRGGDFRSARTARALTGRSGLVTTPPHCTCSALGRSRKRRMRTLHCTAVCMHPPPHTYTRLINGRSMHGSPASGVCSTVAQGGGCGRSAGPAAWEHVNAEATEKDSQAVLPARLIQLVHDRCGSCADATAGISKS